MTPASEHELALSMMRLWGKDAGHLARNYALNCWRKGDAPAYNRWHCVERIVEQAQAAPEPYAATVSGLHLPRVIPNGRRRGWFEGLLEVVMPAIRQLGSGAIRGAGL
jgi:hypothetical protein